MGIMVVCPHDGSLLVLRRNEMSTGAVASVDVHLDTLRGGSQSQKAACYTVAFI
jgi:hypothetical protein